jgi:hypothetical protein
MKKKPIVISSDGKQMLHDGAVYKRTVLPSAAKPSKDSLEVLDALENLNSEGPRES